MTREYLRNYYISDFEFATDDFKWIKIFEKIFSFETLKPGWDGDHAIPPSKETIDSLVSYLKGLRAQRKFLPPSRALATTDGSLIVEWQTSELTFELEVNAQGEGELMMAMEGYNRMQARLEELESKLVLANINTKYGKALKNLAKDKTDE